MVVLVLHGLLGMASTMLALVALGENNPAGEGFKLDITIELNLSAGGYI